MNLLLQLNRLRQCQLETLAYKLAQRLLLFIIYSFQYICDMLTSHSNTLENNILAILQQENDALKKQLALAKQEIRELKQQVNNLQQQLKQYIDPSKSLHIAQSTDRMRVNDMENYEEIFTNSQQDDCMSSNLSSQLQKCSKTSTPASIKRLRPKKSIKQNDNDTSKNLSIKISRNPLTQRHMSMKQQQIDRKKDEFATIRRKKISAKELEGSSISSNNSGFYNETARYAMQFEEGIPIFPHNNILNPKTPQSTSKAKPKILQRGLCQIPIKQSIAIFENSLHVIENSSLKKSKIFQLKNSLSKLSSKQKSHKKIFQTFFVTGYSITTQNIIPEILYYYPKLSGHFHVLLDLMFGDIPLKTCQLNSNNNLTMQFKFKDAFILPLTREGSEGREMQYLFACETQEILYDGKENYGFIVPRMYCFITQWKFFNQLKSLTYQLVKTIQTKRNSLGKNLTQSELKSLLQRQLQSPLERVGSKNIQHNQSISISQTQNIRIQFDIPSQQQNYKMIADYQHWRILQKQVRIRSDKSGQSLETSLLAALTIYILTEHKIILFSGMKSKISEALFHCLQIIKPLEYINPTILGSYRDSFQEYIEAPIPLILGVWHEQKKSKQKLQIFVTKKLNMIALIQNGKLIIEDGIVFNLDSGLIFGGAVSDQLNNLVRQFNLLLQFVHGNRNNHYEHFKIFNKMINGKEGSQLHKFWKKLQVAIANTQLYCFFRQQNSKYS